jgi:tetratricopeptide (TPR) repeat protein
MTEPLRTDSLHASQLSPDAERDAKIESLLLAGLDQYFAGEYGQAIDIWTRALFLDRGHARARAYIERARKALAEQQRESEELLHNGVAALERGEIDSARQLLNLALEHGTSHDAALAGLARVNRVAAASPPREPAVPSRLRGAVEFEATGSRWSRRWVAVSVLCLLGTGVTLLWSSWEELRPLLPVLSGFAEAGSPEIPAARIGATPLSVPRSSEAALDRATALYHAGRLDDALRAVDLVRLTDPLRGQADQLKAAIQRQLLGASESIEAAPGTR